MSLEVTPEHVKKLRLFLPLRQLKEQLARADNKPFRTQMLKADIARIERQLRTPTSGAAR